MKKIDTISFEKDKFVFEYNNKKAYSDRKRKKNFRNPDKNNEWETVDNPITENLVKLLKEFNIDYKNWENLIEKIIEKNEKSLYSGIFYNFNAILSIRNSIIWDNSTKEWDFISCPCCDFDCRKKNSI